MQYFFSNWAIYASFILFSFICVFIKSDRLLCLICWKKSKINTNICILLKAQIKFSRLIGVRMVWKKKKRWTFQYFSSQLYFLFRIQFFEIEQFQLRAWQDKYNKEITLSQLNNTGIPKLNCTINVSFIIELKNLQEWWCTDFLVKLCTFSNLCLLQESSSVECTKALKRE